MTRSDERTPAATDTAGPAGIAAADAMTPDEASGSFLAPTPPSPAYLRMRESDLDDLGYVMNVSRLWGRLPEERNALFALLDSTAHAAGLSLRQRGVLIAACASTLGDSYCSLAWGGKLAKAADADIAVGVLRGDDAGLDEGELALADWARRVAADPNDTTAADLEPLRQAGYDDTQIIAITTFVALRLAFSTVNDALGAQPDATLVDRLPPAVRDTVTWGRAVQR